jgi:hypothetical protein
VPYDNIERDARTPVDERDLQDDLAQLVNAVATRASGAPWNLSRVEAPAMGQAPFLANVENWLRQAPPTRWSKGKLTYMSGQLPPAVLAFTLPRDR